MRQVLFIQGGGEGTYDDWDIKLVDSLRQALGDGYDVRYPRMPDESDPSYVRWKQAIESACAELEDGAILIGHSVGATILINAIAEDPPQIALSGIFLVAAPFVGEGGWPSGDGLEPREKLGADLPEGVPIHLYHGSLDDTAPPAHLDLYAKAIPQAVSHLLDGRDHQLNDDLSEVASDIRSL